MSRIDIAVPDLGNFKDVPVIDVLVKPGDQVEVDTPLVTLETDKATMDVPSSAAGRVAEVLVRNGDRISTGSVIVRLEAEQGAKPAAEAEEPAGPDSGPDASAAPAEVAAPSAAPAAPSAAAASAAPAAAPAPVAPGASAAPAATTATPGGQAAPAARAPQPDEPADATTQVLVLGAGPGGYTAAFRAADLGLQVTLVERWATLGGVCLNVGCIPSKALLHAAKVIEDAESMAPRGIEFGKPSIDATKLRGWKNSIIKKLTSGLASLAKQRKVTVVRGAGKFASPHVLEVELEGGRKHRIRFEQCIIAAGSEAVRLPGVPDDPRIIDSTGALELPQNPGRMLVIGGGIIGLEMACVYDGFGAKVTVVELTPQLIPGCDPDLVKPLEKRIRSRYEAVLVGTKVASVEPQKDGIKVTFSGDNAPGPQIYDRVLVAVGRKPNGASIGADKAGVVVNERGFIPTNAQMRTNVPHIFAIGDVAGQPMLAHKATHEAKVAAEAAAGEKSAFDAKAIPSVAYTDPEIAWAGLTELEAKAKGIAFEKAMFPWAASGRSLALGREDGFTKLLFDPQTHRLLGAGIVGTNAGDLISEAAHAIEMGSDAADIGLTVHPHPTLSETIAFAAEAFEGTLTDLYIPKAKAKAKAKR